MALASVRVSAFAPSELDWGGMSDEVLVKGRNFDGQFSERKRWEGLFCDGSLALGARLAGVLDKIDFDLKESGNIAVYANLTNLKATLTGTYQSDLSLCATVGIAHPIQADRAEAYASVSFVDRGENVPPKIQVHISEVTLHSLQISRLLPSFTEEPITRFANNLLKRVWATSLGKWIDEKVAKVLKEKLPQP